MNKTGLHCPKTVTQTITTNQLLPSLGKNTTVPYFDGYKKYNCNTSLENGG